MRPSKNRPRPIGDHLAGGAGELVGRMTGADSRRLPDLPQAEDDAITAVFNRLASIYGHLWTSTYRTDDQRKLAKLDWLRAIRSAGLTRGHIQSALDYCAECVPRLPNLPEFLAIARDRREEAAREALRASERLALAEPPEDAKRRQEAAVAAREARKAVALVELAKIRRQLAEQEPGP